MHCQCSFGFSARCRSLRAPGRVTSLAMLRYVVRMVSIAKVWTTDSSSCELRSAAFSSQSAACRWQREVADWLMWIQNFAFDTENIVRPMFSGFSAYLSRHIIPVLGNMQCIACWLSSTYKESRFSPDEASHGGTVFCIARHIFIAKPLFESRMLDRDRFLKKSLWERRVRVPKVQGMCGVWGGGSAPSPEKNSILILNGRILVQTVLFVQFT